MRIRRLFLSRYRQFIDETLTVDPRVTVLVGRNDSGKTSLLNRFFDQYFYVGAIHGADRPLVPEFEGQRIAFRMTWDVAPEDYRIFPLAEALGRAGVSELGVKFEDADPPARYWNYSADGEEIDAYEGMTAPGQPIRRAVLQARYLFPQPHYVALSDRHVLQPEFHARIFGSEPAAPEQPLPYSPSTESLVLRLAGFQAQTRPIVGGGIDEPWPGAVLRGVPAAAAEVEAGLAHLSEAVTTQLRRWWDEPPGLTFSMRLAPNTGYQEKLNSYLLVSDITDSSGLPLHGAGILWFVSFLIHVLHIEKHPRPVLLLFDEPATPLHPKMQRVAAKLLDSLSDRHQVIYSTHSPFMIDWNFPQRIRLFLRDYESKRSRIVNKPYAVAGGAGRIWDPIMSTIGVTLGDIAIIGEQNLLVEGVTDQIILANASAALMRKGRQGLDLARISIIPFGEEPVLQQLLATARSRNAAAVVLCDGDDHGRMIQRYCQHNALPHVRVEEFSERATGDSAIEDVVGTQTYIEIVNRFYSQFDWFTPPLNLADVERERGGRSLAAYLERFFRDRFGQSFSKVPVTVQLVEEIDRCPEAVVERLARLIAAVREAMAR